MGISVGGINLVDAIINLEFQVVRTQLILEWVLNESGVKPPDQASLKVIEEKALQAIQTKYPDAGIKPK